MTRNFEYANYAKTIKIFGRRVHEERGVNVTLHFNQIYWEYTCVQNLPKIVEHTQHVTSRTLSTI